MFGLCDCDSFFASCERVFRPELYGKPVVVLSNNDGCIVAMTREAKQIGLKRGMPLFQIKDIIEKYDVAVFSSNFALYGDISSRVMQILAEETGDIDIYSIDEAFFSLDRFNPENLREGLLQVRNKIFKGIGIPVSIGVAPTRTLAKVASHYAKRYPGYKGVCIIDTEEKRKKALELLPVRDVWGIGRKFGKRLDYFGITTAADFVDRSESWIRNEFHKSGVQTWKELKGIPCKESEELSEKQSICTSRSFEKMVCEWEQLVESTANFASACAGKLRRQHTVCQTITVFVLSNRFREDLEQYYNSRQITMNVPTNSTMEIVNTAIIALRQIFRKGIMYKKCGVVLSDISSDKAYQQDIFDTKDRLKLSRLTKAIDSINNKNGTDTIHLAIQNVSDKGQNIRHEHRSPCYTTNINDVLIVKV